MSKIVPDDRTMRNIKNVLIAISIVLMFFIVVMVVIIINNKSTAADKNQFQQLMSEKGYDVLDETYKYSSKSSLVVTSATLAKNGACNIRLLDFYDTNYSSTFLSLSKDSYDKKKTSTKVVAESFDEESNYILETSKSYVRISRVDNKVLEASGNIVCKQEIDDLFKKLGY